MVLRQRNFKYIKSLLNQVLPSVIIKIMIIMNIIKVIMIVIINTILCNMNTYLS
jgi:hypothetical protein